MLDTFERATCLLLIALLALVFVFLPACQAVDGPGAPQPLEEPEQGASPHE